MELNLTDELVLIALDDEDGRFIADTAHLHYGIAGSILLELALKKRIDLKDDKVVLTNYDKTNNANLDRALELIADAKKNNPVKHWINKIGLGAEQVKDETVNRLMKEGILRKDAGKILWIIPTTKFMPENPNPENKVRQKLRDIVLSHSTPDLKNLILLSLIEECDLTREVFKSKEDYNKAKKHIKNLTKAIQASNEVNESIQNIHSAVTKAISSAIITSTTVTTTSD